MYTKQWSTANPGLLIILLDQSASMSERFTDEGESKAIFAAKAINSVIWEMVERNMNGELPRNRVKIAVIGYNYTSSLLLNGMLGDVARNPKGFQSTTRQMETETGRIEIPMRSPYWIEPQAQGNTEMLSAFKQARNLIEQHVQEHRDSPAPIIINITDGEANNEGGCDAVKRFVQDKIWTINTEDGQVLTFNIHIDRQSRQICMYPASIADVPGGDLAAEFLVESSSVIPPSFREVSENFGISQLKENARGCVINNPDGGVLISFIRFGSSQPGKQRWELPPHKEAPQPEPPHEDRPTVLANVDDIFHG